MWWFKKKPKKEHHQHKCPDCGVVFDCRLGISCTRSQEEVEEMLPKKEYDCIDDYANSRYVDGYNQAIYDCRKALAGRIAKGEKDIETKLITCPECEHTWTIGLLSPKEQPQDVCRGTLHLVTNGICDSCGKPIKPTPQPKIEMLKFPIWLERDKYAEMYEMIQNKINELIQAFNQKILQEGR